MSEVVAYYPPETRAMPLTLIRRERLLPVPGKVLVNTGEKVLPTSIVAQAEISGDMRVINVARGLRVPASQAARWLKVKEGDDVLAGTVVAARGLLRGGRVLSPTAGFVYRVDKAHGRVLIKVVTRPFQLAAYLGGMIASVTPGQGVVIETTGAVVQATVGFGDESFGVLQVAAHDPTDVLRAKSLDVTVHGAIVVGGAWIDEAALQQAAQLQVRGLIAGSMDGRLIDLARSLPFPILLTEGLGRIPMSWPLFRLLHSQAGREASISALTRTRWGVLRPEILIPMPADSKPALATPLGTPLTLGARVRVVRGSLQGAAGAVVGIPERPVQIDSGARVHGAEVDLEAVGQLFVPFANLEILRG
jgi:hypothetical protein